jgi:hypothetical protein
MSGKNKINPSVRRISVGAEYPATGSFSCCDWVGEGDGFRVGKIVGVGDRVGVIDGFKVGVFKGIDVDVGVIFISLGKIVGVVVFPVGVSAFDGVWVGRLLSAINWGVMVDVGFAVIVTLS